MRLIFYILISLLLTATFNETYAQCVSPVNSFPYFEDFEASDGGWITGTSVAVPSDWEWGSPSVSVKTVITTAASGSNCWIAGGLAKNSYNDGERSWLQSPCFNISSIANPQITFKVFWETEKRYDGASFQYSTDGGGSWQTLGSVNSNSSCLGSNWFNYDPVNFLSGPGWSGNVQPTSGSCQGGLGSGGWLTARHSLLNIAGATSVIFRFTFAAGTTCNVYDGFAIDDVGISETPANSADFTYTCNGNNSVSFTNTSGSCRSGVAWDFGDPSSGANNISSLDNPVHVFSAAGSYTVKLISTFISGPPVVTTKNIDVLTANTSITNPISCNNIHDGAISVNVIPAGSYNYSWDTNPVQTTPSINNLGAGVYTVFITGNNSCSLSLPVTLAEPAAINIVTNITDAVCGAANGSISSTVTGGVAPYTYSWSNSVTAPSVSQIAPGVYSLVVTDNNSCNASANNLQVKNINTILNISLGVDRGICPGETLLLNPGNFASYKWQDNSTAATYPVTTTGNYSVMVTDTSGCSGSASVHITVDCSDIYFPSAFTPNNDNWNDDFGALGNLGAVKDYKLVIYGRWGEIVFSTTDPYKRWNGFYKGASPDTQSVIWTAIYTLNNHRFKKKGSVILIK